MVIDAAPTSDDRRSLKSRSCPTMIGRRGTGVDEDGLQVVEVERTRQPRIGGDPDAEMDRHELGGPRGRTLGEVIIASGASPTLAR